MDNIYIEILKYGRDNDGLRMEHVVSHLNERGLEFSKGIKVSTNTTLLINIFRNSFQNLDGEPGQNTTGEFFYLKPEALAYLLSYEANEQAKIYSEKAIRIAIWSLWLAIVSSVVSIIVSLYAV